MLNSIQVTKNYYMANREDIIHNQFLRYKYRMRRKIMYVANENRRIFYQNQKMAEDEMSRLLKDQFSKLRTQILKDIGSL